MQYEQHRYEDVHGAVTGDTAEGTSGRRSEAAILSLMAAVLLLVWAAPGPAESRLALSVDPELGVPIGEPLLSPGTGVPPVVDGIAEALWSQAPALDAALHYGLHGQEPAGNIELRSLHDQERVYFLARWPSEAPSGGLDAWHNLMTVHWRLEDPGVVSGKSTASEGLACTVGCHTATADGQGHLVGIRSETIPPGLDEDLPSAGGWSEGEWLLEWSRPKTSQSPYDQNLLDPELGYRFFVKLFLGLEDRPDPTTDVHELRLRP